MASTAKITPRDTLIAIVSLAVHNVIEPKVRCPMKYSSNYVERLRTMLIHGKIDSSSVNGPGNRAVLWFQGCSLSCKGCWNPETHAFHEKTRTSIGEIQDWIKNLKDVEGITFSGGEPMQQAPYLYVLMAWIKDNRPDLSIGMYTGYTKKELENGTFKWMSAAPENKETDGWHRGSTQLWEEIKKHLDFAVVGRYIQSMACHDEPLRGSRNQEVLFISDLYKSDDLPPQIAEVTIGEDALIQITGYPTVEFLEEIRGNKPEPKAMSRKPVQCVPDDDEDGDDLVSA
jgi:anaerobic ribonucleoside-triphosphate reductase activating protein